MGGFNKSQTTKNKTQPSKQGTNFVNSLVNLATKTAKQPLQQYTGPRVAGFTPDQTAGMNAVRSAQGVQTPYINTAAQYAAQGANPITGIPNVGTSNVSWNAIGNPQQVQYNGYTPDQFSAEGLAQFYNPYQQNVIDSTLQNIARADSLQQGDLLGKAISSGASPFGGDRAGLAAAELARGQSMARNQTVAELQNTGYNTALGAFQNQQGLNAQAGMQNASNALTASQQNAANWMAQQQANQNAGLTASQQNAANQLTASQQNAGNALTAAQANQTAAARAAEQFGGLGTQAQQQALTGASALLQTGGLQQQLEQNRIDIPYQQFQEQQQYPQQQAQWLLNTLMGVPATSWGTTSTTQQPGPSAASQILGGVTSLASLGLGFKRGGVADYADGGAVSYAPAANYGIAIPMLNQNAFAVDPNAGYKGEALPGYTYSEEDYPPIVTRLPKGMRRAIRGIGSAVGAPGQQGAAYGSDEWASQGGPGALIWREIAKGLQGGILGKQNYKKKKAIGGGIGDDEPSFSLNPLGDIRLPQPVGIGAAAMPVEDAEVVAENAPAPRTIRIPTDRPIITAAAAPPPSALPPEADGFAMPPVPMAGAPEGGDRGASRFSQFLESPMGALFQGSLATMAGESPFAGVNIGRGLLTGVQAFQAAQAAKANTEGDRDQTVITRDDGSVYLLYPDSGETVEVMGPLPKTAETVVVGDKLRNKATGEVIGDYEDDGTAPVYEGTSMDAQNWNIVLKGDPASSEYAAAYTQLFLTPKMQPSQNENGETVLIPVMPAIPSNVKPPVGTAVAPSAPGATPSVAPADAASNTDGGVRVGPAIVTGAAKPTEQQNRQRQLYAVVKPELDIVKANFAALTDLGNQAAAMATPQAVQSFLTTPEYQRAQNAMRTIIATYLYSTSGATANPGEVENQIKVLMPMPGESAEAVADKLRRVETMVESIKTVGGPMPAGPINGPSGGGTTVPWEEYFK